MCSSLRLTASTSTSTSTAPSILFSMVRAAKPTPLVVLHLDLLGAQLADRLHDELLQPGKIDIRLDVGDGAPGVGEHQIQTFSASGVKRRMQRSFPKTTMHIWTQLRTLFRSLLMRWII